MNPIPDEVGRSVRGIVDVLRASPALLAIIVMQTVTMFILAWTVHERNAYEASVNKTLIEACNLRLQLERHQ